MPSRLARHNICAKTHALSCFTSILANHQNSFRFHRIGSFRTRIVSSCEKRVCVLSKNVGLKIGNFSVLGVYGLTEGIGSD